MQGSEYTFHSLQLPLCLPPNQVSALVTMYSHLGDVSSAVDVLDDAVEHAQKNKVSKRETGAILY